MKKIISIIFIFVAFLSISPTLSFAAPPATPTITSISPPLSNTGITYSIGFTTTDPDFGNQVYYQFDWDRNGVFEERYPTTGTVPTGGAPRSVTHTWTVAGDNSFHMRAVDSTGEISPSLTTSVNLVAPNGRPTNPVINTASTDLINQIHNIAVVSTDPERDNIKYEFDQNGDGSGDSFIPTTGYYTSGTTGRTSISWSSPGSYVISFRTHDDKGKVSDWSSRTITITSVQVPDNPVVTTPSTVMFTGTSYPVNFSSTDPNGDQVYYQFDWNVDGRYDERHPTTGTVPSGGAPRTINHTWTTPGVNGFYVITTDTGGNSSGVVREEVTITLPPPPTLTLTATPATIPIGGSAVPRLTWTSTNTTSTCTASGNWSGSKASNGTQSVGSVSTSKVYTLTCTGTDGSSISKTATVNVAVKLIGWGWSSNTGWISFNSDNPTEGTGASYAVTVATTSTLGTFSGYAWSSNIGWISFSHGDAGHPNATVDLSTGPNKGKVSGWARACAGTVNRDCTGADAPGGWDGWISLSGVNHESPFLDGTKGVTLNSLTGKFNGHSWGSDVVGWLTFDSTLASTPPVTCLPCITSTVTVKPRCDFIPPPVVRGNIARISWTTSDVDASAICTLDGSPTNPAVKTLSSGSNKFTVICNKSGGVYETSCSTVIPYSGGTLTPLEGQMWVDDDNINKTKTTTVIRTGDPAIVNWYLNAGSGRSSCRGVVRSTSAGVTGPTGWFSTYGDRAIISGLARGIYDLGIDCDGGFSTNDVRIIVRDSSIEEI
jgi:hypothetical protein